MPSALPTMSRSQYAPKNTVLVRSPVFVPSRLFSRAWHRAFPLHFFRVTSSLNVARLTKEFTVLGCTALQRLEDWGDRTGSALRRPARPLLGFRGVPGTPIRSVEAGHWFRPTRTAFRRPSGSLRSDLRTAEAVRGPPCALRAPSEVHRSSPAPWRGPCGHRTMLPLLGFSRPTTHSRIGGSVPGRRLPAPPRATSGVWLPPSRRTPPFLPAL
jgi:hypothetical protein